MLGSCISASASCFMRSSKSPLYFVPATNLVISNSHTTLSLIISGTCPSTISFASPCTTAVLPTPLPPVKIALDFFFRATVCTNSFNSCLRPIKSSYSSYASFILVQNCANTSLGVIAPCCLRGSAPITSEGPKICSFSCACVSCIQPITLFLLRPICSAYCAATLFSSPSMLNTKSNWLRCFLP